jgi:type IV pilus assembly protein PilA
MLHKLRNRAADQKGFTLIELLVVILIIGILAAIAIPSFLNQRDKANDADGKAVARSAQTAMETHLTDSPTQSYTGGDPARLKLIETSLNDANALTAVPTTDGKGYAVSEKSDPTGNVFTITRAADGKVTRTCTTAGKGGCPAAVGTATTGSW